MVTARNRLPVIALMVVGFAGAAMAQAPPGYTPRGYDPPSAEWRGQSGLTFLQIGASARAEGLGGAYGDVSGDPSAVFYNPAGMARIGHASVFANRTNWIADMAVNHVAAAGRWGIFAAGATFTSMDYGTIEGTLFVDNSVSQNRGYERTGNVQFEAWAAGAFLAVGVTDRFAFGGHLKYAVQDFGRTQSYRWSNPAGYLDQYHNNRVEAILFDFGTQYNTGFRNLMVSMALQNLSTTQKFFDKEFEPPLIYNVGFAFDAVEMLIGEPLDGHQFALHVQGVERVDVPLDAAVGLEYISDLSFVREGMEASLRVGRRAARYQENWLSAGAGLVVPFGPAHIAVDYSYNDYGSDFSPVNRIGLGIRM